MNELVRARRLKKIWERFLEAERRALQQRCNRQLARLLAGISPTSEPAQWDLVWLAQEDQELAEAGLVELRSPGSGEVEYKHIDELSPKAWGARLEAERVRLEWILRAQRSRIFAGPAEKVEREGSDGRAPDGKSRSAELPTQELARAGTVVDIAPGRSILRLRDVASDSQELRDGKRKRGYSVSHPKTDGGGRAGKVFVGNFDKRTGPQGVYHH